MDINTEFCRTLLNSVMEEVRQHTTPEQRKKVWVYHFDRDNYEFHGPNDFYWNGRADNKTHARAQGWMAYLRHIGVEGWK